MLLDVQLQVSHSHSSSQTLIQLLYYIMVGGERKIDVARVVERQLCYIVRDKYQQGKGLHESWGHCRCPWQWSSLILANEGSFTTSDQQRPKSLSWYCSVSMPDCASHFPQWWSCYWHEPKVQVPSSTSLFFYLKVCPHVGPRFDQVSTFACIGLYTVHIILNLIPYFSFFFLSFFLSFYFFYFLFFLFF